MDLWNSNFNNPVQDFVDRLNNETIEQAKRLAPKQSIDERREQEDKETKEMLDILRSIEQNTAHLAVLVDLIHTTNTNQNEIIEIIKEFFEIAKVKENPAEARTLYRQVMDKLHTVTDDGETIIKLVQFGGMMGMILKGLGVI
jgi:predicted transcriptional regulator